MFQTQHCFQLLRAATWYLLCLMKLQQNADLRSLNSFGIAAKAHFLFKIESEEDLLSVPAPQPKRDLLLGGGSNILLLRDVAGNVLLNRILGIALVDEDADSVVIEVGAGENWHNLVKHALEQGWHGMENLALIPGLAGAAPIQNIGAYGVELADVLESVTAWDWSSAQWMVFSNQQCQLAYRDSIFKHESRDRYFITSIRVRLQRNYVPRLDYAGLRERMGNQPATARNVFDAVVALRQEKLPDPALLGNAGSFFKNPVLGRSHAVGLLEKYPHLPHWTLANEQLKFSAAAMIEAAGMKGLVRGPAAVSSQHALVLVNLGGASGQDLWALAQQVQDRVLQQFGVPLEPEPRIFPAPAAG